MTSRFKQFAAAGLLSLSGCAMFGTNKDLLTTETDALKPSLVATVEDNAPVRRVVRLETSIVSALSTDRRIRQLAWEELDESGLMSPEDRRRLNESGLRIGVAGGNLPWALSSLLRGERVQQSDNDSSTGRFSDGQSSSRGSHLAIPEGSSSLVELPNQDQMLIVPAGRISGLYEGAELKNARCMLEITATRHGDGWVVVRFLPQIHYGTMTTRYSVSGLGEQMPTRQRIQPLYEQQFELKLHTNETVVIGHQAQHDWTVGRMMFQSDSLSAGSERLMVLRLEQIEEVKGQKSMTVDYRKF